MKYKIFSFFLIIFLYSTSLNAQENKKIDITYLVTYTTSNGFKAIDDTCHLTLLNNQSIFKGIKTEKFSKAFTKLLEKTNTISHTDLAQHRGGYPSIIIKNYNENNFDIIERIGDEYIGYKTQPLKKNWQLLPDTLTIQGVLCNKAIRTNGSSSEITVEAWYAGSIPIPDGPITEYGLPGLIMRTKTSQGLEAQILNINYNDISVIKIPSYSLTTKEKLTEIKAQHQKNLMNGVGGAKLEIKKVDNGM
ncbi:MAG: GLPGLI family protein [Chryseobacterium cucumeris]|nr:MAG: GLPGLI family protein [Chryseobacterium cucumeris]